MGYLFMNLDPIGRLVWSKTFRQLFCWHKWQDISKRLHERNGDGEVYQCTKCEFKYTTSLAEY